MAVARQAESQPVGEIIPFNKNRGKKKRNCLERKLLKTLWRWEMRWIEDSPDAHGLILKRLLKLKRRYASLRGLDELGRLTREVQIEVAFHLMEIGNRETHKTESQSERMRAKKRRKERRQSRKPRGEFFRRPVYVHL